jgi:hypothetical protein
VLVAINLTLLAEMFDVEGVFRLFEKNSLSVPAEAKTVPRWYGLVISREPLSRGLASQEISVLPSPQTQ